eukprot:scaffold51135_cov22-Tisochrysis_lutea.AAC.2
MAYVLPQLGHPGAAALKAGLFPTDPLPCACCPGAAACRPAFNRFTAAYSSDRSIAAHVSCRQRGWRRMACVLPQLRHPKLRQGGQRWHWQA